MSNQCRKQIELLHFYDVNLLGLLNIEMKRIWGVGKNGPGKNGPYSIGIKTVLEKGSNCLFLCLVFMKRVWCVH